MSDNRIRVGVTLGDMNGIGPEVVVKVFSEPTMLELCTPVIYGSGKALAYYKKTVAEGEQFQFTSLRSAVEAAAKRVNLVECVSGEAQVEPGKATADAGKAAVEALRAAVADLRDGTIDVLVTAPINKQTVQGDGFDFKGHTEFLASELGGEPLMLMCSEVMKVGLATIHTPISEVAGAISKEKIVLALEKLRRSMIADFGIVEPRLAVLSLNPHAGDGGLLGREEQETITPAIAEAREKKMLAFGPFPADGFFASLGHEKYDAVLAMYHDQGLAPFKALTPDGVNFTAGLNFVRTSPDHGTAYDIAGKGVADPASMRNAVYMAIDIFRCRARYAEMTANPLQHFEREKGGKDLSVKDLLPEAEVHD